MSEESVDAREGLWKGESLATLYETGEIRDVLTVHNFSSGN
ncbi:hypothetical protein THF5H11_30472 [Vibrio jasicida]|uniref:Uncharacterized protein n=1 Tax=Vibrio jasicida TaxID=766224 RepID=A0AAU9QJA7_9VIBR|nr:hypothetical protein THF5H11_30472 [Vibrio jasicida]CAH1575666.1 hypothetical protein THF1C08_20202 [Vibrio jasicida]CAH1585643.1 hypothetical protein THF1A12_20204 [Vibrio jasicida]CAH1604270.1 hypothetical protein THF5G08_10159 [Vibrio jasicida]